MRTLLAPFVVGPFALLLASAYGLGWLAIRGQQWLFDRRGMIEEEREHREYLAYAAQFKRKET